MTSCYAQEETIVFEKRPLNNDLYKGVFNFFSIKNEKNDCKAFYLTSNNGAIIKNKCSYRIIPKKLYKTEVCIFKIVENDTIFLEERSFNVKTAPLPRAEVGGKYEGTIRQKELQVQLGVAARNIHYYIVGCTNFRIKKFRILVMRDEKLIGTHLNIGSKFDDEAIDLLRKIKPKDKVSFTDIYTTYINGEEVKLNAVEFEIVE